MRGLLRTPILQRVFGRGTALITFTGRRSGRDYTTPVSYSRRNGRVLLTAHESRQWWRNVAVKPRVRLRLAGEEFNATARIERGRVGLDDLVEFYQDQPLVARASGVRRGEDGKPDVQHVKRALDDTVVVVADLIA
jgi:deazaflavin-dependent oxidoreductase (nitroreductase family)